MSLRMQALSDLFKRYGKVFRTAWQHRKEMESPIRHPHEAAFLPATLALQETPVHPAPRVSMWLIMGFALLALLWSIFGFVDVVATATGKIIHGGRSKVIQPMETASIRAIHVSDGQIVSEGQSLIELDTTVTGADIERLGNEWLSATLEVARYQTLLNSLMLTQVPELVNFPPGLDESKKLAEARWVEGQYQAYMSRIDQLEAVIARRKAEVRVTQAMVEKIQQILPILRQRESDYQELLLKNHVSRHQYLELKSEVISQERDLIAQQERVIEIEALKTEAISEKEGWVADSRQDWLNKYHDADRRAQSLKQELVKAESRGQFMLLTAPVDGVVQQLAVHTLGGVVTPAQALMVIVPQSGPIEVEAFLPNKDIGFVHSGQNVEVKVETFSFTKYGTIDGKIVHVSSDAIQDEKLGLVFSIKVHLDKDNIWAEGNNIKLSPGMAVTVEIKTAKRRLIEYFLSPFLRHTNESLRER